MRAARVMRAFGMVWLGWVLNSVDSNAFMVCKPGRQTLYARL